MVDTEWQINAPWESDDFFDIEFFTKSAINFLVKQKEIPVFFYRLQVEVLDTNKHIGSVSSYYIDDNYKYTNDSGRLTIGIDIYSIEDRGCGFGTEAWILYIDYIIKKEFYEIYTQTWSGNYPSQGLMKKLGFELVNIVKDYQVVKGNLVDGYTFKLNLEKFNNIKNKVL